MVDDELLEILVCPETKQPVALADKALLGQVNEAIEAGKLLTRGGDEVTDPLEKGIVREDRKVLYPVRDEIPVMLVDEAFDLTTIETG